MLKVEKYFENEPDTAFDKQLYKVASLCIVAEKKR